MKKLPAALLGAMALCGAAQAQIAPSKLPAAAAISATDVFIASQGCSGSPPTATCTSTTAPTGAQLLTWAETATQIGPLTTALTINLNGGSAPTPLTGTALQLVGANSVASALDGDSYAANPIFTGRRADGTNASPSAVQSGDVLVSYSAHPYDGTAYATASVASMQFVAAENFTTAHHGAYINFNCVTPASLTSALCAQITSTGLQGAIGQTTAAAGSFTTLSASSTVSGSGFSTYLASPPAIGGTAAAAGSFTTLSATSTVSGAGFSTYLASPPAIGGTTAAAGTFTTGLFTGATATPSAAGQIAVGGFGEPSLGANDEGAAFASASNGAAIMGKGSVNDVTLINSAGSTACTIPTGTTLLNCNGYQVGGVTVLGSTTLGSAIVSSSLTSVGTLGSLTALGAVSLNGGSSSSATGIGNSASYSGTITIGNSSNTGKTVLAGLTTGTNADTLCVSSGGVVQIQAAACTISSKRFKDSLGELAPRDALADVMGLNPVAFAMKPAPNRDPNAGEAQFGLYAEDVARTDPRCAIYEDDMKTPKSYRQECIISELVGAVKAQQGEIAALRHELHEAEAAANDNAHPAHHRARSLKH